MSRKSAINVFRSFTSLGPLREPTHAVLHEDMVRHGDGEEEVAQVLWCRLEERLPCELVEDVRRGGVEQEYGHVSDR